MRIEDIQPEGAFLYELAGRNWINAFDDTEARLGELARSLAALVKSGKEDPAMLPFDRGVGGVKAKPTRRGRLALLAAGGALALAVIVGAAAMLLPRTPAVNQRFAFFGFDSAPALEQVASVAADTMFKTMASERMDVAAPSETLGTDPAKRLEKATALGAQYALMGDIHQVEGGKLVASVQLMDVPSKSTLWPATSDAPADNPTLLADRIAYRAVPVAKCTASWRLSLAQDDLATVRLLDDACQSITLWTPTKLAGWRTLAVKAPDSPELQASFIAMLGQSRRLPPDPPHLREEAEAALARIKKVAPESPAAYRSRVSLLNWDEVHYAQTEALLRQALERAPDDSWTNYVYAAFLRAVGRLNDSVTYIQTSAAGEPLSPLKQTYLARTMAVTGVLPVEGRKIMEHVLQVQQFYIAWYVLYGTLPLDSEESIKAIMDAAPPFIPQDQIDCARTAATTARALAGTPGKAKGGKLGCDIGRVIRPDTQFGLFAYAGDLDAAFDVRIPRLPLGEMVVLFQPSTRAARMDPRFEDLVTRLGIMDYWKSTGHMPDFCETEKAPICDRLRALKPH